MTKVTIGTKVRVKDNAFGDSTDAEDVAARGKVGEIVYNLEDTFGPDWAGCIEVQTEDDDFLLLTIDEIEPTEAQPVLSEVEGEEGEE